MAYSVFLKSSARRELERLSSKTHDAVVQRLQSLQETARPIGCQKLQGRSEYKLRVGNLRIIYGIDDNKKEILVYIIDYRKQVYRRLREK